MKTFEVQGIEINAPFDKAFKYISDSHNLPQWTNAFKSVNGKSVVMRSPNGDVEIKLKVNSSKEFGTVDWFMTFPDKSVASAYSRLIKMNDKTCAYSFVLMAPPVVLEDIEGALKQQSKILSHEMKKLKGILEK